MKKALGFLVLLMLSYCVPAFSVEIQENGVKKGQAEAINFTTNCTVTKTASALGTFAVAVSPATSDTYVFSTNSDQLDDTTAGTLALTPGTTVDMNFQVAGGEAKDALLTLWADEGDDTTDKWSLTSDHTTNGLLFKNNTTQVLGIGSTGIITLADSETLTNSADALILTGDDSDTAFRVLGYEAKEARIQLEADQDDDETDGWEIASSVSGTLTIGNDSSAAGTFVDKVTIASTGVITTAVGTVHTSGTAVAITAGTTPTITVVAGRQLFTDTITTDNQDQTIGVSGVGSAGDEMTIIFVTDTGGSADEVITFGTNIRSTGTLTLANATASRYVVTFVSDGTKWNEKSRTAIQAA